MLAATEDVNRPCWRRSMRRRSPRWPIAARSRTASSTVRWRSTSRFPRRRPEQGLVSRVAGDPDVLLVPDIEAGNALYKQAAYLAGAELGGLVLGAAVPVLLTAPRRQRGGAHQQLHPRQPVRALARHRTRLTPRLRRASKRPAAQRARAVSPARRCACDDTLFVGRHDPRPIAESAVQSRPCAALAACRCGRPSSRAGRQSARALGVAADSGGEHDRIAASEHDRARSDLLRGTLAENVDREARADRRWRPAPACPPRCPTGRAGRTRDTARARASRDRAPTAAVRTARRRCRPPPGACSSPARRAWTTPCSCAPSAARASRRHWRRCTGARRRRGLRPARQPAPAAAGRSTRTTTRGIRSAARRGRATRPAAASSCGRGCVAWKAVSKHATAQRLAPRPPSRGSRRRSATGAAARAARATRPGAASTRRPGKAPPAPPHRAPPVADSLDAVDQAVGRSRASTSLSARRWSAGAGRATRALADLGAPDHHRRVGQPVHLPAQPLHRLAGRAARGVDAAIDGELEARRPAVQDEDRHAGYQSSVCAIASEADCIAGRNCIASASASRGTGECMASAATTRPSASCTGTARQQMPARYSSSSVA